MTRVVYEPSIPAMRFAGHAGAGRAGSDPVCAALSMLMYTLLENLPDCEREMAEGFCAVSGGDKRVYEVIARGLRRLAADCPEYVGWEVRT